MVVVCKRSVYNVSAKVDKSVAILTPKRVQIITLITNEAGSFATVPQTSFFTLTKRAPVPTANADEEFEWFKSYCDQKLFIVIL